MIQNRYDKTGSAFVLGQNAENSFVNFAQSKGYTVKQASANDDMRNHIDFHISKDGKTFAVDVKSEKKVNRSDANTQNDLIWLEYLNVRGQNGWMYGTANFIAFQDGDNYLMIPREKLLERADSLVTGQRARNAGDALYKLYTRFNRQDLLTMVKKSDIVDLNEEL